MILSLGCATRQYAYSGLGNTTGNVVSGVTTGALSTVATVGVTAGLSLVTGGLMALWQRSQIRGQQKVEATQVANSVERFLKQNLEAWNASPKTQTNQRVAIQNFNLGMQTLEEGCGKGSLEQAGLRCIEERQRGGKFPWPEWYLDPIVNDPNVVPDPTPIGEAKQQLQSLFGGLFGGSGESGESGGLSDNWSLLLGAGLIVLAVMGDKR